MVLPDDRDYTATQGGPIRPETFNRIQDQIIALKGLTTMVLAPMAGVPAAGATGTVQINKWSWGSGGGGGTGQLYLPLPVRVGDRLRGVSMRISNNDDPDTVTATLRRYPDGGSPVTLASDTSNLVETLVLPVDHVVLDGNTYALDLSVTVAAPDNVSVDFFSLDYSPK
jgi:hypothetical protein